MIGGPAGQQVLQSVQVGDSGHPLDTDHPLSREARITDGDGHGRRAMIPVRIGHLLPAGLAVEGDGS